MTILNRSVMKSRSQILSHGLHSSDCSKWWTKVSMSNFLQFLLSVVIYVGKGGARFSVHDTNIWSDNPTSSIKICSGGWVVGDIMTSHQPPCWWVDDKTHWINPNVLRMSMVFLAWTSPSRSKWILTLRMSEAGIPTLRKLPYGVRSRYTGGTEVNARRPKSVYRQHGMSTPGARSRYTDCFLMRTGIWMPES